MGTDNEGVESMILYRVLGGLDDTFKWKTTFQGDTQFYAFFDDKDYESASPGADKYQDGAFFLLKDFILGLDRYPLYIHAFGGGSEICLSKVGKRPSYQEDDIIICLKYVRSKKSNSFSR